MRALIGLLMATLIALPFVLGDPFRPRSAAPRSAHPDEVSLPGPKQHWVQFGTALLGALAGASAAFVANFLLKRREERRRDLASGNSALATIGQMYSTFLRVRRMMHEEVERRDSDAQGAPLWLTFDALP